ncbi:MAG: hypothetical protein EOO38_29960, partial [Cytophagaceae bacterium]
MAHNEENAILAARHVKNITLAQAVGRCVIEPISVLDKTGWFQIWHAIHQYALFKDLGAFVPFVGCLYLDKAATFGLCTTPDILSHICDNIHALFPAAVAAVPSPSCLAEPVIFIFVYKDIVRNNDKGAYNMDDDAFLHYLVRDMPQYVEINGVSGVTDVFVRGGPNAANTDDYMVQQGYVSKDEYFIETNGGDIVDCFMAAPDMLDEHRSIATDPAYVYNMFGVETCRQILITEIKKAHSDTPVDYRHTTLLADCMLQSGHLTNVTRQSQQKARYSG